MNSRERIEAAFAHQPPDRVPIAHISFSSDAASKLLGREAYVGFGIQQWREAKALWEGPDAHREFIERTFRDTLDLNRACGNDIMRFSYGRCPKRPTRKLDDHTFLYEYGDETEWQILRYDPAQEHINVLFPYRPRPRPSLDDLERRVAELEASLEEYDPRPDFEDDSNLTFRAQRRFGEEAVIRASGGAVNIPRDEAWLEAVALRPDLVGRLLDVLVERAVRQVAALLPLGLRYFFGGGDFAGNQGPMYSPRTFHELVLPRLQRLSEGIHRLGGKWLFASDGNLWPVADDLFGRSGVDGFYEIDSRAGMDLAALRERFPRLVLVGNLSSHILHRGTREEVIAQTRACVEVAKRTTGVIVGVSNMVMPGTPAENIEAMVRTLEALR